MANTQVNRPESMTIDLRDLRGLFEEVYIQRVRPAPFSRGLAHAKTHQFKIGLQLYLGYNKLILKELSSECDMVLRRHD